MGPNILVLVVLVVRSTKYCFPLSINLSQEVNWVHNYQTFKASRREIRLQMCPWPSNAVCLSCLAHFGPRIIRILTFKLCGPRGGRIIKGVQTKKALQQKSTAGGGCPACPMARQWDHVTTVSGMAQPPNRTAPLGPPEVVIFGVRVK